MDKIKILIAPNSFKECAGADEISKIIEKCFKEQIFHVTSIPISDGGDGFLNICEKNYHLEIVQKEIPSFFDDSVMHVPIGESQNHKIIYLETAEIIGTKKIPMMKRDPLILNSSKLGELLKEIANDYPKLSKIVVGLGGTVTSDLGLGLCVPFGLKLFNKDGDELPVKPKYFGEVNSIILPSRKLSVPHEVVTDVEIPLFGETGTSKIFARQKGANDQAIEILERGVKNIISILKDEHGLDFSSRLIGAGGGLILGLSLIANLEICLAEEFLLKKLKLEEAIRKADFIITGEGSFDSQSLMKKGTGILINNAKTSQKRTFVICGKADRAIFSSFDSNTLIFPLNKYFSTVPESITKYEAGIGKACEEIKSYILSHP